MEDKDEYDFSPTQGNNLSALFKSDDKTVSTLQFSAPKQPKVKKDLFYKFIQLYQLGDNSSRTYFNRHVIALIRKPNQNEILIYQTKTNILIKAIIDNKFTIEYVNPNGIKLKANDKSWLIDFETDSDRREFRDEFLELGGKINNDEKIINRLAKIGLPLLPIVPPVDEPDVTDNLREDSLKPTQHEDHKTSDLIEQLLLENKAVNRELRSYLDKLSRSDELSCMRTRNESLESKLKALELKCENLETEMSGKQSEINKLKNQDTNLENKQKFAKQLKILMNELFAKIQDHIDSDSRSTIAQEIRKTSLGIAEVYNSLST